MKTPDITPAQIGAAVMTALTQVVALAVAFGVPMNTEQQAAVLSFAGSVVALAIMLVYADSKIRAARAEAHGKTEIAKVIMPDVQV